MVHGDEGETLLDSLTHVDELVQETRNVIRDDLVPAIQQINPEIQTDKVIVEDSVPRETLQIEFSTLVPADGSEETKVEMPFNGLAKSITLGFPDGTQQTVGVGLFDDKTGDNYFPSNPEDRHFAANDFFGTLGITFPFYKDDVIVADFKSNDPEQDHFINCMLEIVSVDEATVAERK